MIYFDSTIGIISKLSKISLYRQGNTKSNQTVQQEVFHDTYIHSMLFVNIVRKKCWPIFFHTSIHTTIVLDFNLFDICLLNLIKTKYFQRLLKKIEELGVCNFYY